jgi:hypothetical protein
VAVQSVPGVGPILGAVFVAEVGDVHRFARAGPGRGAAAAATSAWSPPPAGNSSLSSPPCATTGSARCRAPDRWRHDTPSPVQLAGAGRAGHDPTRGVVAPSD